jgi:SAM-dependent methyltransferase
MTTPPLSPNAWLRWDLIRKELAHRQPSSILELGMGQGGLGARLAPGRRYVGVEPDDRSRSVARTRLPAEATALADLDELAPGERFDVVCAFEVLEHIEHDVDALRAWAQRLSPGGTLLLSVPAHPHRFAAADELVGHHRRYSREGLAAVLAESGLGVQRIDAVGFPLGHLLEAGRNWLAQRRLRHGSAPQGPDARSATSGRTFQPPPWLAWLTQAATAPFRLAQRPFRRTELGTGWLIVAGPLLP